MKTVTILNPQEADEMLNWCKSIKFEQETFGRKPTCRLKKWWGFEAEFYFNQTHTYEREPIESDRYLAGLRDRFLPECDSILLYYYKVGATIGEHLDKKCFDKWVRLINVVDGDRDLFGNRPTSKFKWNRKNYELHHGEVVEFDSQVIHSVPPVKAERYSLQFRKIAAADLPLNLQEPF